MAGHTLMCGVRVGFQLQRCSRVATSRRTSTGRCSGCGCLLIRRCGRRHGASRVHLLTTSALSSSRCVTFRASKGSVLSTVGCPLHHRHADRAQDQSVEVNGGRSAVHKFLHNTAGGRRSARYYWGTAVVRFVVHTLCTYRPQDLRRFPHSRAQLRAQACL